MSVAAVSVPIQVVFTASPTAITTFAFNIAADLLLTDGAIVLQLGSDYQVSGGGYDSLGNLQQGTVTVVNTGANPPQIGDTLTLSRNISPVQLTSFQSTGLMTPAMIEDALDKLTCEVQQIENWFYNPFPIVSGGPTVLPLGWITSQVSSGLIPKTSIDLLPTGSIPAVLLPLFIQVSIGDDLENWKLRPMQGGDPSATVLPFFIVPVVNPLGLIWVRVG